jgi:thioredoxin 1
MLRDFCKVTRVRDTNRGEKMATEKVTAANFADVVLKSSTPVLVDFWAEWCGPCRAVGPILEEISNEHGEKIKIVKLNTDEEGSIAMKYGINSIPTMNVFVGGQVVKSIVGARPKPALLKELSEYIN